VEFQLAEDQRGARDAAPGLADALRRIGPDEALPCETGARIAEGEFQPPSRRWAAASATPA
jgi:hypothetical protein